MSYLYDMFTGSLDDLRARFAAVDLVDPDVVKQTIKEHDPEAYELYSLDDEALELGTEDRAVIAALVHGTWVPSPGELLNWLDWHEEHDFLARAEKLVSTRAAGLLGDLFQAAPLGVSPGDWGFCGSLNHADVVELRDDLAEVVRGNVIENARSSSTCTPLTDGLPVEQRLAWVYLSLRDVPDALDVAVRLG